MTQASESKDPSEDGESEVAANQGEKSSDPTLTSTLPSDSALPNPPPRPREPTLDPVVAPIPAVFPLAIACLAAGAAEGVVAARLTLATDQGTAVDAIQAAILAACWLFVPALLGAVLVGLLVDRRFVRDVAGRLRTVLTGESSGSQGTALLTGAGALALSVGAGSWSGTRLIAALSPKFAAAAIALVTALVALASLFAAGFVGRSLLRLQRGPLHGLPKLNVSVTILAAAVGLTLGLVGRIPGIWLPPPVVAIAVFGIVLLGPVMRGLGRATQHRKWAYLALASVGVLSMMGATLSGSARIGARNTLLYRSPYAARLLNLLHAVTDRDKDGYSPYMMGGDCDDRNPAVHPGALDLPNNGLDENCYGGDSKPWTPPVQPRASRPPKLPRRMNVVMLFVDALRPDHTGFGGYHRRTTPRLDEFRKRSTWFTQAYTSAPSTKSALATLFTGQYPHRIHLPFRDGAFHMSEEVETIPEMLEPMKYDRVAYIITYAVHRYRGFEQGFRFWDTPWSNRRFEWEWGRAAPLTSNAIIEYLDKMPADGSRPYYVFAHYRCPHDPYKKHADIADFGNKEVDKYDSAVAFCDHHLGRVLDSIKKRRDANRTAIFVMSDHGELFGEHGARYHGETLYETDVRITLLANVPGAKVDTVDVPVGFVDLPATMMRLFGTRIPKSFDGWDLLPLMFEEGPPDPAWEARPLFFRTKISRGGIRYHIVGAVQDRYKYIADLRTHASEFYDLRNDPDELRPTLEPREKRAELANVLEGWLAAAGMTTVEKK